MAPPGGFFVCLDVHYRQESAVAAAVGFCEWTDPTALFEVVNRSPTAPEAYVSGEFFRRELPYLLDVLARLPEPITETDTVVIDGHVWLAEGAEGLGARLHRVHPAHPAVVGVAKRAFRGGSGALAVLRGKSVSPLYVTAVGMDPVAAAEGVGRMAGPHRIPTLLRRADRLAREGDDVE